ncbi:hypothetical protein SAMN05216420_10460 [Nitrosospira sp. Nl5]|nr:hypothetical protein SAMN05216420_10460 [Nitrosospira sp. Nl5]
MGAYELKLYTIPLNVIRVALSSRESLLRQAASGSQAFSSDDELCKNLPGLG